MERNSRLGLVLGLVLIAIGVLALFGQYFDLFTWGDLWPFIIIGVGAVFFIGMALGGKETGGLAIPGSIIVMIGLILLFQSIFNMWETWSYAWALIVVAVGIGMVIYGRWSDLPEQRRQGFDVIKTGVTLFIIFGAIFTFIYSMTGMTNWQDAWVFPIALVILGAYLLISRSVRMIRANDSVKGDDRDLFWPVMFIGIGLLWISIGIGLIPQPQVGALLSLWPIVLILIGINLLFGRRHAWVGALMGVIVVVGLFAYAGYGSSLGWTQRTITWLPEINLGDTFVINRVDGSGTPAAEERQVSGFTRINVGGSAVVEIVQGDTESLVIEADDNILPLITSKVSGNTLEIMVKPGYTIYPDSPIRYTITVVDLNELDVSGAVQVRVAPLAAGRLSGEVSGAAAVVFEDLQADTFSMDVSGAGKLTASGVVDSIEMEVSGSGVFDGGDLQALTADFEASGAGLVTTWVVERLDAQASGAGIVSYYGSPAVKQSISGAGKVTGLGEK